ncbi:MAG: glycosyltransferase [Gammaproteobacteria bacterium]|nr:glycosyltransferase [Gammaproteobacteria bacterium]
MEPIKVSVIVPVYNLQDYVESCIKSLVLQDTHFKFEVIAIDDCSTDNSWLLLKNLKQEYPDILQLQKNEENQGLAVTMRSLLKRVRGQYIVYLDGDDLALPEKLQYQADYLDSHDDCFMVYHEMDVFDSETDKTISSYSRDYYNREYIPEHASLEHLIRYGCFMHVGSIMFRNHQQLQSTADNGNKIILDHPWLVLNMVYGQGSIDFIDKTLGRYRIHSQSFGGQTRESPQRRVQVLNEQLHVCDLAKQHGLDDKIVQAGKRHYQYATALFFLRAKQDQLFSTHLKQSTDGKWFLNSKHKKIWDNRDDIDTLRNTFYPE